MHLVPNRILFLLLFFSSLVVATNFTQCLTDFMNGDPDAIGGVDSHGHPVSVAEATGLTYKTCTARCGRGSQSFNWREFAQLFASWLLPWLALVSQLPFGSGNYADDFVSVALSVGSPALAAYSLLLTSLNARLVYRRAQRIKHESKNDVARALISLQQTPLELTQDEHLLASIPINDQWRKEIVDRLNRRNAWSVATGSSVVWVVIAFIFTLIDSFVSLGNGDSGSGGLAVGTLWLWLLCLVIGWLWVPTFTCGELKSALNHANRQAAKKAAKRLRRGATKVYHNTKANITKRVPILKGFKKPVGSIAEADEKTGSIQGGTATEPKINFPLPNTTQQQPAASLRVPDSQHGHSQHGHQNVSGNPTANPSVVSLARSAPGAHNPAHPEPGRLLIARNNFGSLNRDELRLAATFNYSRIMRYLVLVDDVLRALDRLTKDEKNTISTFTARPVGGVVFPPGALASMFNATIFALILQVGTTAAATAIIVFTPTIGLGCRSLGYIIYGGTAIVILFLTIISTLLARISETRTGTINIIKGTTAFIAIALRRISLLLAFINATGLIAISCFQFSNFLDNCYCNASVIGRGTNSYLVIFLTGWISTMRTARIVAILGAAASMAIYMIFLWLMSALPSDIDFL